MTKHSIASLALVCACSVDPDAGMPFTGGAEGGATANPEDDEESGGTEASSGDESGSADSNADPSTTAADDSTGDASATITTTDATTGVTTDAGSSDDGAASLDEGGDDGANDGDEYQACTGNDECTSDPGLACLTAENGGEGFCSPACGTMGASPPDPQLCPDAPVGVTATVVCLEGFLVRNCALSCAGGLTCPEGTECLPANNGGGPYCFGSGA